MSKLTSTRVSNISCSTIVGAPVELIVGAPVGSQFTVGPMVKDEIIVGGNVGEEGGRKPKGAGAGISETGAGIRLGAAGLAKGAGGGV